MKGISENPAGGCVFKPENYSGTAEAPSLACLAQVVGNIINVAFLFLGAACIIFLFYGALLFVLSRGDQKAVQKARGTMTYAVIGTVLVLSSYLILNLLASLLGLPSPVTGFTFYQP